MRGAALVALVAFAVYIGSVRSIVTVDAVTNVLVSYSFAREGNAYLDEFAATRDKLSFFDVPYGGHAVSIYPPGAPMFATPFAVLGSLIGIVPPQPASVTVIGKLAAASAAALSVYVVGLIGAYLAGRRIGVIVAALYAFGTATWSISSGALWAHGPAQLALATGLLWSLRGGPWGWRAGLGFGLAAVVRPADALFGAAAALRLVRRPRGLVAFVWWGLPGLVLLVAYNLAAFGSLRAHDYVVPATGDPLIGALGSLIAPSRGLLVYSPFLLFAIAGLLSRRARANTVVVSQAAAAVALFGLYAAYADWVGGYGYGNRFAADALPILAAGLAIWLRRHRRSRWAWSAIAVTGAWSIGLQAIGALTYDWANWSWERETGAPVADLVWRIDRTQWLYALAQARPDAVTLVSVAVVLCAAAILFAVEFRIARHSKS
jgi:hypothetical protein